MKKSKSQIKKEKKDQVLLERAATANDLRKLKDLRSIRKFLVLGVSDADKNIIKLLINKTGTPWEQSNFLPKKILQLFQELIQSCICQNKFAERSSYTISDAFLARTNGSKTISNAEVEDLKRLLSDQKFRQAVDNHQAAPLFLYVLKNLHRFPYNIPEKANPEDAILVVNFYNRIWESNIKMTGNSLSLYNLCDPKGLLEDWLTLFRDTLAYVFCVNLDEFYEDVSSTVQVSRIQKSIEMFEQTCSYCGLNSKTVFVILFYTDTFKDKLCQNNFSTYVQDFTGNPTDVPQIVLFLEEKFKEIHQQRNTNLTLTDPYQTYEPASKLYLHSCHGDDELFSAFFKVLHSLLMSRTLDDVM